MIPPCQHPGARWAPTALLRPGMKSLIPRGRSYYLIEFVYEETPNSYHQGYLSADPVEIHAALEDQYCGTNRDAGIGEQACLWVAQHGVLTHGLDLNPLIRTRCTDGAVRTLAELRELHLADPDSYDRRQAGEDFTVDWDAIAALLPPLLTPRAQPGDDELFLDVPAAFPVPGVPLSTDSQEFLEHGWTDL